MIVQIAEIVALASLPAFLLLDLIVRHRRFDATRFWRLRAFLVSAGIIGLSIAVGLLWGKVFGGFSLIDGARLGTVGGAVVGILVYELVHYGYHRLAHRSNLLWRAAHQMHHSAESLDPWGANYLHPVDTFFFATWPSLVFFPLLGLNPAAASIGVAFVAFNAAFQHANIRTPRWLGYIIQRPESHSVHHERGVHAWNYSDLPLWDIIFGTFRNPAEMAREVGFYKGASGRIPAMLLGRDVSSSPESLDARGGEDLRQVA
jgi:sterol desaturase/sphingolipid hydroxylase (fatty acid hydroxylase superfamily)